MMARIRSIKPDFWTDEKIVELSPLARLLFIGLWNFADDEGRMPYSPTRIKLQILPADSADISALLGEIRGKLLIDVYVVDNQEYLQVCHFTKHQKIDKRTPSKHPANSGIPPESPRIPPTEVEVEGKGIGKEKPKSSRSPSGSRLQQQVLPNEWAEFASKERPDLIATAVFAGFKDYWTSLPGKKAVRLDWFATWRNWVRNQHGGGNGKSKFSAIQYNAQQLAKSLDAGVVSEVFDDLHGEIQPVLSRSGNG